MSGPISSVTSQVAIPTEEGDIKSFDVAQYQESVKDHVTSDDKEALLTQLISTKGGRAWVADCIAARFVPAASPFKKQLNIVVSCAVTPLLRTTTLAANGAGGVETGHVNMMGFLSCGSPHMHTGTLAYNNADDINKAASVQCVEAFPTFTMTWWGLDHNIVGYYVGVGIPGQCSQMSGGNWTVDG